jgi:hypothetical protein
MDPTECRKLRLVTASHVVTVEPSKDLFRSGLHGLAFAFGSVFNDEILGSTFPLDVIVRDRLERRIFYSSGPFFGDNALRVAIRTYQTIRDCGFLSFLESPN